MLATSSSQPCMKVIVVGDGNVGKTSLLRRFVRGDFVDEYRRTIGVEYMEKDVFLRSRSNTTARLMLWDTAGQEVFSPLTQAYYRHSSAAIICFSTVDKESFHHVNEWKHQIETACADNPPLLILCQTKLDLSNAAVVTKEEAEELAISFGMPFFRISTKDDFNVTQLFEFTAQSVLEAMEAEGTLPNDATYGEGATNSASNRIGHSGGSKVHLSKSPTRRRKKKPCCK